MATIATTQRAFSPAVIQNQVLNQLAANQKGIHAGLEKIVSKLEGLDAQTLNKLQQSFFDAAAGSSGKLPATITAAFAVKPPAEALASHFALLSNGYFSDSQAGVDTPAELQHKALESETTSMRNINNGRAPQTETLRTKPHTYGAQSKSPGLFSNPTADKAAEAARLSQSQTQNFLANQLGQSYTSGNMKEFLGPNACFEDVLATVMMNIADKSEKEMMEQIRTVERGETGLNGFLANGAKNLGGIAGGALGGYFGGPQGAAIGYDVGERVVGSYAGQYGGSSRQIQFEKLKMMMHKQSEMMSAISNILATIHATNKNAIGNIRG